MKRINHSNKLEQGQVIVIVAISLFAMIALAAVILDGGALLLNRRTAQNAADAAALAGAREYCRNKSAVWGDPTDGVGGDITDIIDTYATDNDATVLWGEDLTYITGENVGVVQGLVRGEVVVTVQVEHNSFFARLFGEDTLTATASAGAGCFPYGPSVVLPIAFPCQAPNLGSIDGVTAASNKCDYSMLLWNYFDTIATGTCGMTSNPLLEGVDPTQSEIECIRDTLNARHPELIYIVMNEGRICAKDPENIDINNEIICDINEEGHSQLSASEHGWLNLFQTNNNANPNTMENWIMGIDVPPLREHTWLSFATGVSVNPVFDDLKTYRMLDIVWLPVYNYACTHEPVAGDTCWTEAHNGWSEYDDEGNLIAEHPGVSDPLGECYRVDNLPGQEFAHIVGFAPFFTTCVRDGSSDLKDYLKDKNNTTPENFDSECPGFEMAVKAKIELDDGTYLKDDEGNIIYPNFEALEDANYTLEGYFIEPWYLDNPESLNIGGADLGIYTAQLTR
jgi:hypothetical protein